MVYAQQKDPRLSFSSSVPPTRDGWQTTPRIYYVFSQSEELCDVLSPVHSLRLRRFDFYLQTIIIFPSASPIIITCKSSCSSYRLSNQNGQFLFLSFFPKVSTFFLFLPLATHNPMRGSLTRSHLIIFVICRKEGNTDFTLNYLEIYLFWFIATTIQGLNTFVIEYTIFLFEYFSAPMASSSSLMCLPITNSKELICLAIKQLLVILVLRTSTFLIRSRRQTQGLLVLQLLLTEATNHKKSEEGLCPAVDVPTTSDMMMINKYRTLVTTLLVKWFHQKERKKKDLLISGFSLK